MHLHLHLKLIALGSLSLLACSDDTSEASSSGSGSAGVGANAGTGADGNGGAGTGASGTGGAGNAGAASTGGSGTGGSSTLGCTMAWESGFEQGFPGEWLDYDNGSWSANGSMPAGRVSAWTIIDSGDGGPIASGDYAYKGWIDAAAGDSHRAYPGVHTDLPTPVVNTFMVYLEADYGVMSPSEWIHFGTWGNDDGNGSGVWALHTMSVRDRKLEFAHTEPFLGEYIGPDPQPDFPLGQWVRFTTYMHYEGSTGFVQAWQDGVPMLRADVAQLQSFPGTNLTRAHWGMYASSETTQGVQYNDDIRFWTLDAPLADFGTEPDCYLGN